MAVADRPWSKIVMDMLELELGYGMNSQSNGSEYVDFDYNSILEEYYRNLSTQHKDGEEKYKRDLLTYYVMGIGGMTICCLGLIGNMLTLTVLTRRTMKSSTYSYLSALSVCDCLVLFCTIILLVKDVNRPIKGEHRWPWDEGLYPYLFPYIHAAAFTFQVTSVWLTLAFTLDRYIMICHPFRAEPFCTISRARKVIGSLFVGGIIFNIPKYFEYETVAIPLPMQNTTKIGCDLTAFGRSHIFRELYHSWFYVAFVCGVPFLTLAVINTFLMRAVHLSRKKGKEINVAEKKRNDTTIMLISVVVVFFICQMPALVSRTIWAFEHDPQAFKKFSLYALNEIGNFLIVLNSSINIVPYYFFGRRFRKQFWQIFCSCLLGYKKFEKISRSFSVTMLEARRNSTTSNHGHFINKPTSEDRYELQCLKSGSLKVPLSKKFRSSSIDSTGSGGNVKDPATYKRLSKTSVELNGNCVGSQSGQTTLLPKADVEAQATNLKGQPDMI